jgi:Predicted metal-dependent hydrolase
VAVVDLSHVLSPSTPLFPVYDPVKVADKFRLADDGFNVRSWAFDEHSGTHVDAPSHFADDAPSVDRLDPEDLVLPLAVLDLRDRAARNEDLEVGPDDVLAWGARARPPAAALRGPRRHRLGRAHRRARSLHQRR